MINYKQDNQRDCSLFSLANLFQDAGIVKEVRGVYKSDGYNFSQIRWIIENIIGGDKTTVTIYSTDLLSKPIRLVDDNLLRRYTDEKVPNGHVIMGFTMCVHPTDKNKNHATSFYLDITTGKVAHFDSLKENYKIYESTKEFIDNVEIHGIDLLTSNEAKGENFVSMSADWIDCFKK